MQHGVLKRIPKTTARRQGAGSWSPAVASLVRVARQLFQTLSLHHIARSFISLSTRTAPHPHVLVPAHIGERSHFHSGGRVSCRGRIAS
jgi:hypothetical protein